MFVWLCVIIRIVANPLSNVFQKTLTQRAADPLFIICATHGLLSLACAVAWPCLPASLPTADSYHEFWTNLSISAVLAVAGNTLLVQALKRADLSVLGPLNAYKPVVSLVPGLILLGELPGHLALGGIALIVAASVCLTEPRIHGSRIAPIARLVKDHGVQYRLAALILAAAEAVFLKAANRAATPLVTFMAWSMMGFATSLVAGGVLMGGQWLRSGVAGLFGFGRTQYPLLALSTGLMQSCTIVALGAMHVGSALALFQISTVISVFLGHRFFNEGQLYRRLIGGIVMTFGAILIILNEAH